MWVLNLREKRSKNVLEFHFCLSLTFMFLNFDNLHSTLVNMREHGPLFIQVYIRLAIFLKIN
jgi:hypothetical protein